MRWKVGEMLGEVGKRLKVYKGRAKVSHENKVPEKEAGEDGRDGSRRRPGGRTRETVNARWSRYRYDAEGGHSRGHFYTVDNLVPFALLLGDLLLLQLRRPRETALGVLWRLGRRERQTGPERIPRGRLSRRSQLDAGRWCILERQTWKEKAGQTKGGVGQSHRFSRAVEWEVR